MTSYNIKQITGYDIFDNPSVYYNITVPNRKNDGTIEFITENVEYKTALSGVQINKLGYCVEHKGYIYPIYLEMNGVYKPFQVGKEGMYEMQPEQWKNINNQETEDKTTDVIVTGVRVPANINFTLEYVIPIN